MPFVHSRTKGHAHLPKKKKKDFLIFGVLPLFGISACLTQKIKLVRVDSGELGNWRESFITLYGIVHALIT